MAFKAAVENQHHPVTRLKRTEFTPKEALVGLYDELKSLVQVKRELKGDFVLERLRYSDNDTRLYHLHYSGVIGKIGRDYYIFAYGETDSKSKAFTGIDGAIMFGKINWQNLIENDKTLSSIKDLLPDEMIKVLKDKQLNDIVDKFVPSTQLIVSTNGMISIRNGLGRLWDYRTIPVPWQFLISEARESKSDTVYRGEILPYLIEHVNTKLELS